MMRVKIGCTAGYHVSSPRQVAFHAFGATISLRHAATYWFVDTPLRFTRRFITPVFRHTYYYALPRVAILLLCLAYRFISPRRFFITFSMLPSLRFAASLYTAIDIYIAAICHCCHMFSAYLIC